MAIRLTVSRTQVSTIAYSTPEAIRSLHREGIRIVMMTGDSKTTAQAPWPKKFGIDDVMAEVLPDQKADKVKGTCRVLAEALEGASKMLGAHRGDLDQLMQALIEKETIEGEELKGTFGASASPRISRRPAIAAAATALER